MTNYLLELFNLHTGEEDRAKTLQNVKKNVSFRGANLWILACAVIIASVGLNVNSTAVIIGAMLISPLMGPIVGSGFALAIYDFNLLKKSLINLLRATMVSLLVASLYFYISPFKNVQSELLARTSPNIYDVLIAFFGGVVGAIAITRKEKGNPIPGVAIATALMPPLCTAGYGLATGNFRFFFGALFLYAINCVFICISTLGIVKYLKYPPIVELDENLQKKIKYTITTLTVIMLLPSAYFAFVLYEEQRFKQSIDQYIEQEFNEKGNTVVYKKTKFRTGSKILEIACLNRDIPLDTIKMLNDKLDDYGLTNTKLVFKRYTSKNINSLKNDLSNELTAKDKTIATLQDKLKNNSYNNAQIFREIKTIYPQIIDFSIANHNIVSVDTTISRPIVILTANPKLKVQEKQKLKNLLSVRLSLSDFEIIDY